MFPLPSILQLIPNAEPLSVKLRAYMFNTRAATVPWFLAQGEVSTLYLRNVSLVAVLTLVPVVLSHLLPIVLLPGDVWTICQGGIHVSVQLHCRSRPHKFILMRAQALDLLCPLVLPIPLTPPSVSQMMIALQYDATILLI